MKGHFYHEITSPHTLFQKGIVINADCTGEDGLSNLKSGVTQFVCNDPPFGVTEIEWDNSILDPIWMRQEYFRVIDPEGVVAIFGSDGFLFDLDRKLSIIPSKDSSLLETRISSFLARMSRVSDFLTKEEEEERQYLLNIFPEELTLRYHLLWDKMGLVGMYMHSKNRPLTEHEYVSVFSRGTPVHEGQAKIKMRYFPYGAVRAGTRINKDSVNRPSAGFRPNNTDKESESYAKVPTSILRYKKDHDQRSVKPSNQTAKPIAMLEQLVGMYTTKDGIVVDPTAGSGSTAKAAMNLGRPFIVWERDPDQYKEIIELLNSNDVSRANPLAGFKPPKLRGISNESI